ncbi:hypothetical protein WMF30_33285 [Sorangium sp. So ce134]
MPRAPIGRLSADEVPEPFRQQVRAAQDEPEALRLDHVGLDARGLHEERAVRLGGFEQDGFHVITIMPEAPPRPRAAPESTRPGASAARVLRPPRPLLEADLLEVAARLDYRPFGTSGYGTFASLDDLHLCLSVVQGPEPGQARWMVLDLPPAPRPVTYAAIRERRGPPGLGPISFSREVWAALHGGALDAGGALVHQGRPHHLAWWFDGQFFTARLLPVEGAI